MFPVNIASFKKGQKHRKILEQFALAIIRHDVEVTRQCGPYNSVNGLLRLLTDWDPATDSILRFRKHSDTSWD